VRLIILICFVLFFWFAFRRGIKKWDLINPLINQTAKSSQNLDTFLQRNNFLDILFLKLKYPLFHVFYLFRIDQNRTFDHPKWLRVHNIFFNLFLDEGSWNSIIGLTFIMRFEKHYVLFLPFFALQSSKWRNLRMVTYILFKWV